MYNRSILPTAFRHSIILRQGALVTGVSYSQEFKFLFAQKACAPGINYLADTVEDVFFETMKRQSAPVSKSNWSLLEAGFSRAFVFHMAVVTGAPTIAVLVVLVYLDRMRSRLVVPPACLVHGLVPERLLLGAWILAFQSLYGVPVNRFQIWADATKLFSPAEVEQTIAEIKNVLGGDLSFTEADMRAHCIKLVCFYETWSDTLAQTGFVRDELAMGGLAADGLAQDGRVHAGGVQDGFMHEGHVQHGGVQGNFMQDGSQQDERVQDPQYRFGSVAHGSISDENQSDNTMVQGQGSASAFSLTGGVQRRSVRLVCRSTGR